MYLLTRLLAQYRPSIRVHMKREREKASLLSGPLVSHGGSSVRLQQAQRARANTRRDHMRAPIQISTRDLTRPKRPSPAPIQHDPQCVQPK